VKSPEFDSAAIAVPNPTIPCAIQDGSDSPIWLHELTLARTYAEMLSFRQQESEHLARNEGSFYCPQCRVPLAIRISSPYYRFFFQHAQHGGACSLESDRGEDRMSLSEQAMEAVRESPLHIAMKVSIARQLAADDRFSDVKIEARINGSSDQLGRWRRPDVSASLNGQKIAFEAQLSTTPLKDMQARRRFYAAEKTCLIWIMPNFDTNLRVTNLDDVIVQQDFTALSMTEETIAHSLRAGKLHFNAHRWHEVQNWTLQLTDIEDLSFHPDEGRVSYPIDYESEEGPKDELAERLAGIFLEDPSQQDMQTWDEFRFRILRDNGQRFGGMPSKSLIKFVRAVLLATTGEVIGWAVDDLHYAAARLFETDWPTLMTFLVLLEDQGMALDENVDEPRGLKSDLQLLRSKWPGGPRTFTTSSPSDLAAVKWLFPEISRAYARIRG